MHDMKTDELDAVLLFLFAINNDIVVCLHHTHTHTHTLQLCMSEHKYTCYTVCVCVCVQVEELLRVLLSLLTTSSYQDSLASALWGRGLVILVLVQAQSMAVRLLAIKVSQ